MGVPAIMTVPVDVDRARLRAMFIVTIVNVALCVAIAFTRLRLHRLSDQILRTDIAAEHLEQKLAGIERLTRPDDASSFTGPISGSMRIGMGPPGSPVSQATSADIIGKQDNPPRYVVGSIQPIISIDVAEPPNAPVLITFMHLVHSRWQDSVIGGMPSGAPHGAELPQILIENSTIESSIRLGPNVTLGAGAKVVPDEDNP